MVLTGLLVCGCGEREDPIRREAIAEIAENAARDEIRRLQADEAKFRLMARAKQAERLVSRIGTEVGIGTAEMEHALSRLERSVATLVEEKGISPELFDDPDVMAAMNSLETAISKLRTGK